MENFLENYNSYLSLEKKYSKHTVKAYLDDVSEFEKYLKSQFQTTNLLDVNYSMIRSWIVFMSENKLENKSINRKISSLKSYYKFLLKTKVKEDFPLQKHKSLKTSKKIQIPFSEKEMNLVLNQLEFEDNFTGIRDRLIIELFYVTGIRRAELINLQNKDVDLSQNYIKVLGKRNKERIIPLLSSTILFIKKYICEKERLERVSDENYFFLTEKGIKLNETVVYRLINYYFSNVSEKVKKSPHILRHTFATHLLNNGATINSVKELLGHSSLASTQVYTQSSLAELKKVYSGAHPRTKK